MKNTLMGRELGTYFVFADVPYVPMDHVKRGIKRALKNFGYTSAILSFINMSKHNCITKEKFDELYKTNEESEERTDLSVGEDLETFIGNIKTDKINRNWFPTGEDHQKTFLLCLLDKNERSKLEQKDEAFMRTFNNKYLIINPSADVPEAEWKASESNMKFSWSSCYRDTFIIDL